MFFQTKYYLLKLRIATLLYRILLQYRLYKFRKGRYGRAGNHLRYVAFTLFSMQSVKLFPEYSMSQHDKMANKVRNKAFGFYDVGDGFNEKLSVDEEIVLESVPLEKYQGLISDYHNLWRYNAKRNLLSFHEATWDKAPQSHIKIEELNEIKANQICVASKMARKESRQKIKLLTKNRVNYFAADVIGKVEVTSQQFSTFLAFLTAMFFVSGFLHTKLLFWNYDINVGDFFTINDYVSASIESIAWLLVTTVMSLLGVLFGSVNALKQFAVEEDYGQNDKLRAFKGFGYKLLAIGFISLPIVSGAITGKIEPRTIYLSAIVAFYLCFFRLPIWRYIENYKQVSIYLFIVVAMAINLVYSSIDHAYKLESKPNTGQYSVVFKDSIKKMPNHSLIMLNSNFGFFLAHDTQDLVVVERGELKMITAKKNDSILDTLTVH
ncbi:hypothetical protein [Vibrio splendidus]|uniref:hypothetical protein n=1 Tax=Vibrio splendidus TaxID=29497 RepID=UPI0024695F87|nr:hypothetical protein [Vibrio splendidus]MDH5897693.1 hypothetical protein [Vibrio splendidus]